MRYWTADEVHEALPFGALVDALDESFRGGAVSPLRTSHAIPAGDAPANSLLLMPSWGAGGYVGVKIVMVCPSNAERQMGAVQASYVLMDAETGETRALIDGVSLTLRRTAAASALASRYLSRPDSRRLLMVGAGKLAPHLIAAHAAVRPLDSVEIWARSAEKAGPVAERAARACGLPVAVSTDLPASVGRADIISCATLSTQPLILGEWLRDGQHVDLVGAYTPEMRESDAAAIARSRVYVDCREAAMAEAGDILLPIASGAVTVAHLRGDLADLARGKAGGRGAPDEITLFKSVGIAAEDLAAAALLALVV